MKKCIWFVALVALVAMVVTTGTVTAQPPWRGGPGGKGGRPSFDTLLEAFDDNDDGELSEDEVPPGVWRRLSAADANEDGVVTRKEFESYRP